MSTAVASRPREHDPNEDDSVKLSPATAAVAKASVQVAARTSDVQNGALRIRVLRVTDLPGPALSNGQSSSWLRRKSTASSRNKSDAESRTVAVVLKTKTSSVMVSETAAWADDVIWNEDFFVDHVNTRDELKLYCIDRTRNDPYYHLPLRDDISSCPGFIGRVCIPLSRLPEGEEIEQWYSLVPKESGMPLRTALRVSLCFIPSDQNYQPNHSTANSRLPTQTARSGKDGISDPPVTLSPIKLQISPSVSPTPKSIPLATGVVDYVIVMGHPRNSSETQESQVLYRYPPTDRHRFPLPTKIEWFCFPGGPEIVLQATRPKSKVFSFVLVGGDDGLCRCYVVCLVVYHRVKLDTWYGTCIALLTRVPLLDEMFSCLLCVADAWLSSDSTAKQNEARSFLAEEYLVRLCHEILIPIRGILGVQFTIGKLPISLVLPCNTSIYNNRLNIFNISARNNECQSPTPRASVVGRFSPTKSSSTNFINIQQGFQPLVYSLAPIFQVFDIKTVIHLITLILCEYRVLIHSSQISLLCPVAEGLCALIYPFKWQHPYVPILPRVLSEYLQAPLPYILGIHTSWLAELLDSGRPEHLVVVDIDRGVIQTQDAGAPVLPHKFTSGLYQRLKRILHPELYDDAAGSIVSEGFFHASIPSEESFSVDQERYLAWDAQIEKQVRVEFVCFMAATIMGYRDCLFFVNQKLPVFNKRRFFATCTTPDTEVVPFLTRLFCTQAFQAFLENHSSIELSVFHSIYLTFSRGKQLEWPNSMPPMSISSHHHGSVRVINSGRIRVKIGGDYPEKLWTPVYTMAQEGKYVEDESYHLENGQSGDTPNNACGSVQLSTDDISVSIGEHIETLLDEANGEVDDLFALSIHEMESIADSRTSQSMDCAHIAQKMGVDPAVLEENVDLLRRPHDVNQQLIAQKENASAYPGHFGGMGARNLSTEEERIEQILHKCLTSVFASDDLLSPDDLRSCEGRFKTQYARDLFVLILMQPSHQYVELNNASSQGSDSSRGSSWYNPKGSGSCIGESGFQILVRLSASLMDQCAIHEDFTNARGMLQVAAQYYHFIEDKNSGIGFAKKEYLVSPLRMRPISRSLDMWQHAFSREVDAAIHADPSLCDDQNPDSVSDELFFSVIGSLVYDMLTVEVPLSKMHTFVGVMCSTYQKGKDLLDTLKQLVDNVHRALDMSKDSKASPSKPFDGVSASASVTATTRPMANSNTTATNYAAPSPSPPASNLGYADRTPMTSRQYDLDTVIRRKMSVHDIHTLSRTPPTKHLRDEDHIGYYNTPPIRSRVSSFTYSGTVLSNQGGPVTCLATFDGRVTCGHFDATVNVMDTSFSDKRVLLDGHTGTVTAAQLHGNTLVTGSRDHTLRAWDLRATTKKRPLFSFFSHGPSSNPTTDGDSAGDLDGATVSKKSLVLKGHTGAVTCVELGRQLATDRAIVGSGSKDGTIRLWDTTRESSLSLLGNGKGAVSCLRFLALFEYLVSGSREQSLKVWDLAVSKLKTNIQSAHEGSIRDIQITGDRLISAGNDRVVKVWDAHFRTGPKFVHELHDHGGPVTCVSVGGPADPNVCTGASDGFVRVWDLRYVQKGPRLTLSGHVGPVTCLQRDFTKLVSGGEDGSLRVWDMHSGVCMHNVKAHSSGVTCMTLEDSAVYSGSWDGSVRLWDLDSSPTSQTRSY